VLVGNKLDKEEDREVEYLEGSRWAQENGKSTSCVIAPVVETMQSKS
jgi:hypothetical protein